MRSPLATHPNCQAANSLECGDCSPLSLLVLPNWTTLSRWQPTQLPSGQLPGVRRPFTAFTSRPIKSLARDAYSQYQRKRLSVRALQFILPPGYVDKNRHTFVVQRPGGFRLSRRAGNNIPMSGEPPRPVRIFLTFWALLAALIAVNFYMYYSLQNRLSFWVMIGCAVVFVGWGVIYIFYFRKARKDS